MIWAGEGRHTWYPALTPPMPEGIYPVTFDPTVAEIIAGDFSRFPLSLYDYIKSLGPSLYWPLDATYGVTDQSGNGRNGTGQGGITIGGAASVTGEPTDSSTDFVPASSHRVTSAYNPFTAGSRRTFIFAFNVDDTTGGNRAIFGGTDATHGPGFITGAGGSGSIWRPDFSVPQPNTAPFYVAGERNFLILDWDDAANTVTVYRTDGSVWSVQDLGAAAHYNAPTGNFQVGAERAAGLPFDGKIAHAAVVERGLTAEEADTLAFFAANPTFDPAIQPDPLVLNRLTDDSGDPVYPRHRVRKITGLAGSGESGDRRDVRVGAQGEIPRRSRRRGKTITYEGVTQAQSRAQLRAAEADLRAAFDDQSEEGWMVVTPHPLYDSSGDFRYFPARALACEVDDQATFSPARASLGHESPFVIALRNARAGGASYFDQDDNPYP